MTKRRTLLLLLTTIAAVAALASGCSKPRPPAPGTTTIGDDVNAIVRGPSADEAPYTVLFLHGGSYSSRIWDDRGILDAVASDGYRAVAVDLPGHGGTPDQDKVSDAAWLRALVDDLGGPERVVVVSPSMSGRYSLSYLQEQADAPLAGFVPVAPVGIDEFERADGAPKVPAMLVWGELDDVIPRAKADRLQAQLPGSRLEVIADAGHAAYDDHPEQFTALLVAFLGSLGS